MADEQHIRWLFDGREAWRARRFESRFSPDFSGVDLYQAFRNANKLGSDGAIPLAGYDLRNANFVGSLLNPPPLSDSEGADLRGADLYSADFRSANLTLAKLDGADLHSAKLGDARLVAASLRETDLTEARLPNTNLEHADLTDAKLRLAYLEGANLRCATLDRADLTSAELMGADLEGSRPWTAMLFPPTDSVSEPSDAPVPARISSIAQLLQHCSELRDGAAPDRVFYFRGERKSEWKLEPSVMRSKNGHPPLRVYEGQMLLELMSQRPEDFSGSSSALSQWVLAQHHGLNTRLLDVTRNPLVALLGACGGLGRQSEDSECNGRVHVFSVPRQLIKPFTSDAVTVIANLAKLSCPEQDRLLGRSSEESRQRFLGMPFAESPADDRLRRHNVVLRRLYHLIRRESPHFAERIDPRDFFRVFVVEPLQSFERIRAQSGAFLISGFHERFERDQVLGWNAQIPLYDHTVLDVPGGDKKAIVRELGLLGFTRESLLPGLDEAASALTRRYFGSIRPEHTGAETTPPGSTG